MKTGPAKLAKVRDERPETIRFILTGNATLDMALDGINNGDAAGRFCWVVEGTLCPGDDEDRIRRCLNCPFLREVAIQEGEFFILGIEISGDVL